MMWGENGQVNGNGQSMYMSDAFQPADQPAVEADRMVGLRLDRASLHAAYSIVDLEGSVGPVEVEQPGRRLQPLRPRLRRPSSPRARSRRARRPGWSSPTGLEPGHQPQLRPRAHVSEHELFSAPSGFIGTVYNTGGVGGAFLSPATGTASATGFAGRLRITRDF